MTRRAPTSIILAITMLGLAPAAAADVSAEGVVYGGLSSDAFYVGSDITALNGATGAKVTFTGTFHSVVENDAANPGWSNTREILKSAWNAETTPFANVGIPATAASIASGAWDAKILEWAGHVKQYLDLDLPHTQSVIIAPLQEANGDWTQYGCDPDNFRVAYRKFVKAFEDLGLDGTRVRFAFAPNGWTTPGCGSIADYFPGDEYVDVTAFSGYNFGTGDPNGTTDCVDGNPSWMSWSSVYEALHDPTEALRSIAPTKPIVVAQTAAPRSGCGATPGNGGQDQWVRDLFAFAANDANIIGVIWFNFDNGHPDVETDWRIWDGSTATQGWKDGMTQSSTQHVWPLPWFDHTGDIVIDPPPGPCPDGATCDTAMFVDAEGRWHRPDTLRAGAPVHRFYFGNRGDIPFMGDWNGDGTKTPGLYRQSDGYVYLRNANTQGLANITFFFGNPGDIPIAGDFNNDGYDTVSIYRPSEGRFYIINQLGEDGGGLGAAETSYYFGNPGDMPFVGDFDGDGIDTIGLYRMTTGFVYFRNTHTQGVADFEFYYGNPGDIIMAGDWNGDGTDTVAVYRPTTRRVYLNFTNAPTVADYDLFVGSFLGASRG